MYELKIDEQTSKGRLIFEGSLKIQNASAVKEAIQNALKQTNNLSINHQDALSFDLSYLQLLIAAHKTALLQNKQLQLEEKHPVEFYSLLRESACLHYGWLNVENEEITYRGENNG